MLKILIVTEIFYPETGLINDFANELVDRGFCVEVLTQHPSYPYGKVFNGYSNVNYSVDQWNGIKIHRFKVVEGYYESKIKKIANYYKFVSEGSKIAKLIGGNFDHILVYQTGPLTLALPAIAIKKRYSKPITTWTFDIWPDAVYAYGFPKIFPLTTFLNYITKKVYRNSDYIFVSSKKFTETISKYVKNKQIEYAPNWLIEEKQEQSCLRLDENKFNFTFTGNISMAQNLNNVVLGWKKANIGHISTLNIVGDGSAMNSLKNLIEKENITNIIIHGKYPSNNMEDIMMQSDALILPLVPNEGIMKTEPFKLQSYLKAAKPILGIIDGAGREIIEENNIGICAKPNDTDDIASKFINMIEYARMNKNNIQYNCEKLRNERFNKTKTIDNVINSFSRGHKEQNNTTKTP